MTLERTLEPEVMDSPKEAQEYNEMDHSAVNEMFVAELLAFATANVEIDREVADDDSEGEEEFELGDVLDLGTGTALIPIELCKRSPEVRVMAIDLAVSMLDLATLNVDVAGFRSQIQLAHIDAKDSGLEDGMFDSVISNSIIHHIPEPASTVEGMIRTTREGGVIFVRDLMRPDSAAEVDSLVQLYTSNESEYSRRLFGESLHASLTLEEMRELVSSFGGDPESVVATSDRHWTWATVR